MEVSRVQHRLFYYLPPHKSTRKSPPGSNMAASRALLSNPHATASPTTTRARARLRSATILSEPARRISRSGSDGALRPKPAVLVAEKLSEAGLAVLRQFADVEECAYGMSPAELLANCSPPPSSSRTAYYLVSA